MTSEAEQRVKTEPKKADTRPGARSVQKVPTEL